MNHAIERRIEAICEEFWRAGLYDPVEIMEQTLYLLFLRRLGDRPGRHPLAQGQPLGWSNIKEGPAAPMFAQFADHVFPALRRLGGAGSSYAQLMKDARFSIPGSAALATVVRLVEGMPRHPGAPACPAYDYLSGRLARIGQRGEFYTPRHIARLMVALVAPRAGDIVCNPVAGDGQLLAGVCEYLARSHPGLPDDPHWGEHFHHRMFHAYDADKTMLRLACMNMALLDVANPDIRYTSCIAPDLCGDENCYSIVLAHPSTACLRGADAAAEVQAEIVMVTQFLRLLKRGGRAAVIVPQHILGGFTPAHLELRRSLVHEQRLDGVICFPSGLSGTPAGAPKAILLFTRTDCGGRNDVWFYDAPRGADRRAISRNANRLSVRKKRIAAASNCLSVGRYLAGVHMDA